MPLSVGYSLAIILVTGVCTFATRAFPFVLFPKGKKIPPVILYIGRVLAPAVIGMLIVYFLQETKVFSYPYGIPEAIAILVTALLHIWKRNNLLSIGAGTVLYMFLVQVVF